MTAGSGEKTSSRPPEHMREGQQHRTKILVVDDDENLRRLVAAYLESEGYEVKEAADGHSAMAGVEADEPQLVVLDLMLMLTARGSEDDLLQGFEAGADDYLVKPFSPKVLVARVKAVLRRSGAESEEETGGLLPLGGLSIDPKAREVWVEGREIELTSTEFELLRVLAEHPGWVYSREDLLESVWGYSFLGDSRLVDVHIANLRKKIGDDSSEPHFVRTVRGVGYKFQPLGANRPT
jgi:two-component system alkaline phosphatase synthesis response regulator PhoP